MTSAVVPTVHAPGHCQKNSSPESAGSFVDQVIVAEVGETACTVAEDTLGRTVSRNVNDAVVIALARPAINARACTTVVLVNTIGLR